MALRVRGVTLIVGGPGIEIVLSSKLAITFPFLLHDHGSVHGLFSRLFLVLQDDGDSAVDIEMVLGLPRCRPRLAFWSTAMAKVPPSRLSPDPLIPLSTLGIEPLRSLFVLLETSRVVSIHP